MSCTFFIETSFFMLSEPIDSDALREKKLARKYFQIWMDKTLKSKGEIYMYVYICAVYTWLHICTLYEQRHVEVLLSPLLGSSPLTLAILKQASWLKVMLFNASSRAARRMACNILYSLCNGETRQRQILDLLSW